MTSRRGFLAGLTSALVAPRLGWSAVGNPVALAAAKRADGAYVLVGLTNSGEISFSVPLPARGHAAAAHPHRAEVVAIARRPGRFAIVLDCVAGAAVKSFDAPQGRHFYGHGAFSSDGTLLFTPENDIETGAGWIGVWDRTLGFRRIDEFSSGGIGPHEILRLANGNLAVANGGIRTHPATGREKLNLDTMRSNLSVFSTEGMLLDVAEVPEAERHNSMRHIACTPDGRVICGSQWQGDPFETPSLVSVYEGKGALISSEIDDDVIHRLGGYIGSVASLGHAGFAASSPKGGRVLTFDRDGVLAEVHPSIDVCGLSTLGDRSGLVTNGLGQVFELDQTELTHLATHTLSFDNHLVALHGIPDQ